MVFLQVCRDETFATGDRECSDFKKVDAYTIFTNDHKKVYIVKTSLHNGMERSRFDW